MRAWSGGWWWWRSSKLILSALMGAALSSLRTPQSYLASPSRELGMTDCSLLLETFFNHQKLHFWWRKSPPHPFLSTSTKPNNKKKPAPSHKKASWVCCCKRSPNQLPWVSGAVFIIWFWVCFASLPSLFEWVFFNWHQKLHRETELYLMTMLAICCGSTFRHKMKSQCSKSLLFISQRSKQISMMWWPLVGTEQCNWEQHRLFSLN